MSSGLNDGYRRGAISQPANIMMSCQAENGQKQSPDLVINRLIEGSSIENPTLESFRLWLSSERGSSR